jgi:hypothetical protein
MQDMKVIFVDKTKDYEMSAYPLWNMIWEQTAKQLRNNLSHTCYTKTLKIKI